ncbi:MAG: GNAT family N-acetyltransferase [Methylococcales bacterium]
MPTALQTVFQYLQTGQIASAEQLCQQLCAADPKDAEALHLLAVIYAQTQRFEHAEDYFLQALACAPKRADFLGNYGNLLYEQGRIAEAINYCQQALSFNSTRPEVHNTLGNAWYKSGKFAEAISCYHSALVLQPNYAEAYNNLGQALRAQQDYVGAEQCFRQALVLQPDFADAANNLKQVDSKWLQPLQAGRLCLRRYAAADVDFLWDCYNNPDFMRLYNRFMPLPSSKDALAEKLQEEAQAHPLQNQSVKWLIGIPSAKSGLRPVGMASLVDIQMPHRRAEFLIGIPKPDDRSAGAGLTATLLIMDFAFNQVGLNKLTTFVYSDNVASQKNNMALGFTQESVLRDHLWHPETQQFIDLNGNGMTLADFRGSSRLAKLSKRLLARDVTAKPDVNADASAGVVVTPL